VTTDAAVHIDRAGDRLTDRRHWACDLPGQPVRIPCGGTHVARTGEIGPVQVVKIENKGKQNRRIIIALT